jgi:hypothetical protein
MVWVKCTTSAERKTIRIAASAVMDSWVSGTKPLSGVETMNGFVARNDYDCEGDSSKESDRQLRVPSQIYLAS